MFFEAIQREGDDGVKHLTICKMALALSFCALLLPGPALAETGEEEFKAGKEAYGRKDYKAAEEHFTKAIQQGNRTPSVWLYAGHTFLAVGQNERAVRTYETLVKNFKDSAEAQIAQDSIAVAKSKLSLPPPVSPDGKKPAPIVASAAQPAADESGGLKSRIVVEPPKFGHQAVSAQSIRAVHEAVANLPAHLRKTLDESTASIHIAPNMIDKWPESLNAELDDAEGKEPPTLAEVPGRIYDKDMYVYERAKVRGSLNLKHPRSPSEMKHTVYNECFQVLDQIMAITKEAPLIALYRDEKSAIQEEPAREKLWTFIKDDEWGLKETCNELVADLFGQGGEHNGDLNRWFPKTKRWLKKRLGI